MKSSLFSQGSWRNLICFKGNSIWLFYKAHHNHAVGDVLSKNQVVRMFTKWDPFIIEMENNKSHPLSWRGIMTMIIRVMMISLSLQLIFYRLTYCHVQLMVGTSILQLLSSATTAVEKYLNEFLSFELHRYTMQWVNIHDLFLYFLWYAQRPFPKFINVESCFGPFLSRSLLSVLVCPCLCLYLHFWTNPISTVCASALIWWH